MKNRILIIIFIIYAVIAACAKMGSLSGGAKDETPPKVLNSKPKNYSTGYDGQKIEITFDEYIVLKDISKELVISPPTKEKSDVRIKNKTIVVDLKSELVENTTYTLNFGSAITDNNEGNPLTNFEFVFSTGNSLDSLSIEGKILNAFDLQPSKDPVNIMLYKNLDDSIPLKEIPVYIGKTDKNGLFRINNLSADTYKIFAIKDQNFNFLFDLPNEEIAFIDTFITLTPEFLKTLPVRLSKRDSISLDSLTSNTLKPDTAKKIKPDSLKRKYSLPPIYVDLFYFTEEPKIQYLSNNQRKTPEHLEMSFNLPLKNDPDIKPLNFSPPDKWYLLETNLKRDTFLLWLNDSTYIKQDTMKIDLGYPSLDTLGNTYIKRDTLIFLYRKPPAVKLLKGIKQKDEGKSKLKITTITNKGTLDLDRNIPFVANYPLENVDSSRIKLSIIKDSVEHRVPYDVKKDSISPRKIFLDTKWTEKAQYKLRVYPGAFTDMYENINDTLIYTFTTADRETYGKIILLISGVSIPMIVELMGERDNIISEKYTTVDGRLVFDYIKAGKYKLKFVYDVNNNRKWDTGIYLKHIQPERVAYRSSVIDVKANWDVEISWAADADSK